MWPRIRSFNRVSRIHITHTFENAKEASHAHACSPVGASMSCFQSFSLSQIVGISKPFRCTALPASTALDLDLRRQAVCAPRVGAMRTLTIQYIVARLTASTLSGHIVRHRLRSLLTELCTYALPDVGEFFLLEGIGSVSVQHRFAGQGIQGRK